MTWTDRASRREAHVNFDEMTDVEKASDIIAERIEFNDFDSDPTGDGYFKTTLLAVYDVSEHPRAERIYDHAQRLARGAGAVAGSLRSVFGHFHDLICLLEIGVAAPPVVAPVETPDPPPLLCPGLPGGPGRTPRAFISSCGHPARRDHLNPRMIRCSIGHTVVATPEELEMADRAPKKPLRFGVAVAVTMLPYDEGELQLLWGKRLNTHGAGTWAFPGGELHPGESVVEAAVRELREETGIGVDVRNVEMLPHAQPIENPNGDRWVCFIVTVRVDREIVPRAMEPHKCEQWVWRDHRDPPSPMFESNTVQIRDGVLDDLETFS